MNDPMATVRQYADALSRNDIEGMAALTAVPSSILDGLPPHAWQGETAVRDWYRDVMAEAEHLGTSDYTVTLEEPLHNEVNGDSAYVVAPASMTFKVHGEKRTQSGAVFTVALRQLPEGWRITAWAWAKGAPQA